MFREIVRKYEKNSILASICMLILSCFLIFKPMESMVFIIYLFSIIVLVDGVIHISSYIKTDKELKVFSFEFTEGILEVVTSILMMIFSSYLVAIFPIVVGIWMILKSLMRFQMAINLKACEEDKWIFTLIFSIITFIFGIIIFLNPFETVITVTVLAGILLCINEIINIIESVYTLTKLKNN